jgi:hypothetical protein
MPRLYRSAKDLNHWFTYMDGSGWMMFPAKVEGWKQRRPIQGLQTLDLREVPLWLSFGTGLLESARNRTLTLAA